VGWVCGREVMARQRLWAGEDVGARPACDLCVAGNKLQCLGQWTWREGRGGRHTARATSYGDAYHPVGYLFLFPESRSSSMAANDKSLGP
jgi:hypothetical protein